MTTYIYIIDSMFYEKSEVIYSDIEEKEYSHTVEEFVNTINFEDLPNVKKQLENIVNQKVEIHLVDINNKIKYYYTNEGKLVYSNFINMLENTEDIFLHKCNWGVFQKTLLFYEENTYIFTTVKKYRNKYEMGLNLDGLFYTNRYYLHNMENFNEILDEDKCTSPLNIFQKISKFNIDQQDVNEEAIKWLILNGIEHAKQCFIAGFLDPKIQRFVQNKVPAWTMQTETFYMKGVIYHNNLFPKEIDIEDYQCQQTIQEKFLVNSSYRNLISLTMCKNLLYYISYKDETFTLDKNNMFTFEFYDKMKSIIMGEKISNLQEIETF